MMMNPAMMRRPSMFGGMNPALMNIMLMRSLDMDMTPMNTMMAARMGPAFTRSLSMMRMGSMMN